MTGVRDRVEAWLASRVLRAPSRLRRLPAALRPIRIDDQVLDPDVQFMLGLLAASGRPRPETLPVAKARRQMRDMGRIAGGPPIELGRVENRTFVGPATDIPVRIYARANDGRLRPGLVFYHGGGGVVGDLDSYDEPCRSLADRADCVVASVDYRLGPEDPFPAAVDDAFAAFRWVASHASELGIDPRRVAVGGDSMGGNLSAVVSQLARDDGGRRPCFQLLVYPATDRAGQTRSKQLFARGFLLTEALHRWFHEHYAGVGPKGQLETGGADPTDPRISPLRARDVRDVAPALVVTAGFDPLRDEGEAYARRLRAAGVDVRYRCYRSLIHGFIQMAGVVPAAADAMREIADELARAMYAAPRPQLSHGSRATG